VSDCKPLSLMRALVRWCRWVKDWRAVFYQMAIYGDSVQSAELTVYNRHFWQPAWWCETLLSEAHL